MFFRLFTKVALVGVVFSASLYVPLQAQQQDTLVSVPKTTSRPFWIWQILGKFQPSRYEYSFTERLNSLGAVPLISSGGFTVSPFNIQWNHNSWILSAGYAPGYSRNIWRLQDTLPFDTLSGTFTVTRVFHEATVGIGYALVNSPRFRLYPSIAALGMIDIITITEQTSFARLLRTLNPRSITLEGRGIALELGVGADYRFLLEYGDLYLMAKIGYNLELYREWAASGQPLGDTYPNWFSRRGIFFQIGVGFGTERH
jgi:hypothetical protein